MPSAHATHPGLIRQNNEDCILTDDDLGIYLLADGIGGHNAGEVASALAVDTVYRVLRSNISHTEVDGFFELMVHAIQAAHWEINSKALSSLSFKSMGTTLVAVVLRENKAYIVHAGDSRCYLFRNGFSLTADSPFVPEGAQESEGSKFNRLTRDHTVGDQQLASGVLIEDIPKKHFHNLIQAVGCGDPPYPDFNVVELKQDDILLVCSDGLTDMLSDSEIAPILANGYATLDTLAGNLIEAANANGGRDNVSVIVIKPF